MGSLLPAGAVRATARADTQSPLWHPEPAERSCAAGEATPVAFSYRLHAKTQRATSPSHTNKKLHNLFPTSVHSLLVKRNYQCSSLLHLGFRNVSNHCLHPNNLHQREQHPKTTPLSTLNERYVVHHKPNQFRYQLVLGYLTLHEFNCAHGSSKPQSTGSISIRP